MCQQNCSALSLKGAKGDLRIGPSNRHIGGTGRAGRLWALADFDKEWRLKCNDTSRLTIGPSRTGPIVGWQGGILDELGTVDRDPGNASNHWDTPRQETDLGTTVLIETTVVEDEATIQQSGTVVSDQHPAQWFRFSDTHMMAQPGCNTPERARARTVKNWSISLSLNVSGERITHLRQVGVCDTTVEE